MHVAAVACHADVRSTVNGGFKLPEGNPDELPSEVHTADKFFVLVDDSSSDDVLSTTDRQRRYWQGRAEKGQKPKTLAEALADAGCPEFAGRVESHLKTLGGLPREMPKIDRIEAAQPWQQKAVFRRRG